MRWDLVARDLDGRRPAPCGTVNREATAVLWPVVSTRLRRRCQEAADAEPLSSTDNPRDRYVDVTSMTEQDTSFTEYVALRRDAWVRAACLLTADPHAAEDLVQSALVRVWPRWRRIISKGDPDAYVRTVLMNVYLGSLRGRRWREISSSEAVLAQVHHATPASASDQVDTRLHLLQALKILAPRQRAVLVLRYYFDLSEEETANALGCSVGTVKSQAFKGTHRLRSHLETLKAMP